LCALWFDPVRLDAAGQNEIHHKDHKEHKELTKEHIKRYN
jgi:hypothetical protein